MFTQEQLERIEASAIADPLFAAAALAVSSLALPEGEKTLALLAEKFENGPIPGSVSSEVQRLIRQRMKDSLEQTRLIRKELMRDLA